MDETQIKVEKYSDIEEESDSEEVMLFLEAPIKTEYETAKNWECDDNTDIQEFDPLCTLGVADKKCNSQIKLEKDPGSLNYELQADKTITSDFSVQSSVPSPEVILGPAPSDDESISLPDEKNSTPKEKNSTPEEENSAVDGETVGACTFIKKDSVNELTEKKKVALEKIEGLKPYKCDQCSQRYSNLRYFKVHKRAHFKEKPYGCESCKLRFLSPQALINHRFVHTGEKPFECDECGLKFSQRGNLNKHLLCHTGERPFECVFCNHRFARKDTLKLHLRKHVQETKVKCPECDQTFCRKSTLKGHLRVHTGEKPFVCKVCNKRFLRKEMLNNHERLHTGAKPPECTECKQTFIYARNLVRHRHRVHSAKNVHPAKEKKCGLCELKFLSEGCLKAHRRVCCVVEEIVGV